jgi:hypothetical protein
MELTFDRFAEIAIVAISRDLSVRRTHLMSLTNAENHRPDRYSHTKCVSAADKYLRAVTPATPRVRWPRAGQLPLGQNPIAKRRTVARRLARSRTIPQACQTLKSIVWELATALPYSFHSVFFLCLG